MSVHITDLKPQIVWKYFSQLNAIPRASKKETEVIAFIKAFGNSLNLETSVDAVGNVLIKKTATSNKNGLTMVLQSHLDMVQQKNRDTIFDFSKQGINMYEEKGWVKAKGTTLGADNGMGVAAMMAVLASSLPHPNIECLFTTDEEAGMGGAHGLKENVLKGSLLLNLDTEDEKELIIGCAGGVILKIKTPYPHQNIPPASTYKIVVTGLTGGHSGIDIHKGRGNGIKIINHILYEIDKISSIQLHSFHGGGLSNAIPREANAVFSSHSPSLEKNIASIKKELEKQYSKERDMKIELKKVESINKGMEKTFQKRLLSSVRSCPNGVFKTQTDMVISSSNLSTLQVHQGEMITEFLIRGVSQEDIKNNIQDIKQHLHFENSQSILSAGYPGWIPKPHSQLLEIMKGLYPKVFHGNPDINVIHAGLECGILSQKYPDMEMVSFGPTIQFAHSPDEKVEVRSVEKFWTYLCLILQQLAEGNQNIS